MADDPGPGAADGLPRAPVHHPQAQEPRAVPITHPFAATARPDATPEDIAALLSEDVVYRSPLLTRPLHGRDLLVAVLAAAGEILDFRYLDELRGPGETLLRWEGSVLGRHRLEGVDIVRDDPEGRVAALAALLRPLPVATLFRDEMRRRLGDRAPAHVWEATDDETPLTAFAG